MQTICGIADLRPRKPTIGLRRAFDAAVSQSLLTCWFYVTYQVSLAELGIIFFAVNVAAV